MSLAETQPAVPKPKPRWFHVTPDRYLIAILIAEGLLWLSDRIILPKGYAVLAALAGVGVAMLMLLAWFADSLVFRCRFQFSVRSLLMLVVVVAVPCGWMAVAMKQAREQKEVVKAINKGAWAFYDYDSPFGADGGFESIGPVFLSGFPLPDPPGPTSLRNLLGVDFFATAMHVDVPDDAGLELAGRLPYLEMLSASRAGGEVTDDGLAHVATLTRLKLLLIVSPHVTDAGLAHLERLTRLNWLWIASPHVTDGGLEHLKRLASLKGLIVMCEHVTDAGLVHLHGLTELQWLGLHGTKVTDAGLGFIENLKGLQTLRLGGTKITDVGLERIKGLTRLESLDLGGTGVTDTGLVNLKELAQLQCLDLSNTQVTDAGLEHVKGLSQLQSLDLCKTNVTEPSVKNLQRALPNCEISWTLPTPDERQSQAKPDQFR